MRTILEHGKKHFIRGFAGTNFSPEEEPYCEMTVSEIETEDFYDEGKYVELRNVACLDDDQKYEVYGTIEKQIAETSDGRFVYKFIGDAQGAAG